MVSSHQIVKGLAMWIDSELLSAIEGLPKYGVGILSTFIGRRGETMLEKLKDANAVKFAEITKDGNYDYELLRACLVEPFPEEGIRIEADQINRFIDKFLGKLAPIVNYRVQGGVTFHKTDIEKLFDYIKEA